MFCGCNNSFKVTTFLAIVINFLLQKFEKIEKYKAMFKKIERFCQINGDI